MQTKTILFEKLPLLCTNADLITNQGKNGKVNIIEQCTQEHQSTKWRFKLIRNVTVFAALRTNTPMKCPDSVLPETLLRHTKGNSFLSDKEKQPAKIMFAFSVR